MIFLEIRRAPTSYIMSWRSNKELFERARVAFKMHFPHARFDGAEKGWAVPLEERDVLVEFLQYLSERFEFEVTGGVFENFHVDEQAADSLEAAFATLHLLPDAPLEVVRAAYKALARLHHPDYGGSVQRMQSVNAAFDEIMQTMSEAVAA
jgi:hypothetical protein